jgi:HK97 family phage major capsid protein
MSGRIVQFLNETSPVRQYASVTTTSSDKITGIYDLDEVEANWEGEGDTASADKTPQLGRWEIPVHNLLTKPRATSNILEDASLDLEGWLVGKIASRFLRVENKAFLATAAGPDAVKRPRGLLSYTTVENAPASTSVAEYTKFQHVKSGSVSTVNNTDLLMDLVGALKTGYQANAIWGMNRKTMTLIRKLKDGQSNYLWEPSYQLGVPPRLLGAPVVEVPDIPDIATNSLSIFYGDLGQTYQVVDRLGISVIRDNLTQWPLVDFKARKRVGGGVINFEALKFMKFEA